MHKPIHIQDIKGKRFGRLVVTDFHIVKPGYKKFFYCKCDCGTENVSVQLTLLRTGITKSCGCLHREVIIAKCSTHGLRNHLLYKVWSSIKNRCNNPNCREYKWYGARGIKMCNEWNDFQVFYDWCMANGWKKGLQIDREKNNGNYEPSNCRIVTRLINMRNRSDTVMVEYKGENKTLSEWAEKFKISYVTLWYRIVRNKMPLDRALQNHRLHRVNKSYLSPLKVQPNSQTG